MKTHYVIPIFIPESACPFRCTYCNQYNITEKTTSPSTDEVVSFISEYLKTIPFQRDGVVVKVAFFGGNFTGLPIPEQESYLQVVQPFIDDEKVHSIQLSTRPDYIDEHRLNILKQYRVSLIELGAQSLDPEVLLQTRRGHTVHDVEKSAHMILQNGFELGLQMMIGLPGDTLEKSIATARKITALGAQYTRIYPTLVIRDTDLEKAYTQGLYQPLTLDQAVEWCAQIVPIFNQNQIQILRIGLHPSEGLIHHETRIAGPFHISFKELVLTSIWKQKLIQLAHNNFTDTFIVEVPKPEINYAIGYHSSNKIFLEQRFQKVIFIQV
ncbi:MAG: radical SAM protein [Bacteroidales bacterium]|nr:radical SAM protein [Bacteroidales bacterium]